MENTDNAPHDVSFHFISINFNLFHLCNKIVKAWHACLCVGVSPLMPRSQARCPWDEWAPEKCKKMSRKHHSSAAKICYEFINCFYLLFPVLRWALHWLPWWSVRDLWACRWGRVGKARAWHHLTSKLATFFCKSLGCQKLKISASRPHGIFLMPRLKDLNVDYAQHCFLRASSLDVT